MATTKPRINVSFSKVETAILHKAAKRDQMPVATKVAQLVRTALEIEEDLYFSKVATERMLTDNGKRLTHKEVWG